jgi:SSS family solute:Na+ symporter
LNGLVKVPMQFLILLLGVLVFAFYQFNREPVFFNRSQLELLAHSKYKDSLVLVTRLYDAAETERLAAAPSIAAGSATSAGGAKAAERLLAAEQQKTGFKATIRRWLDDKDVGGDSNDTNYIFLRFVTDYLPIGLVGLLIAVIVLAAWGSIAATLNALSSCTIVDFHRRFSKRPMTEEKEYRLSRLYTL